MAGYTGKRASRRVAVSVPVSYVQSGWTQGSAQIVELSAGGCLLSGTNLDPRGPEIFLHFRMGADKPEVHLRGHVVHARDGVGEGVEFVSVSPEGRDLLRQYVEEKVAEYAARESHPL
jgi:hypothetical protein